MKKNITIHKDHFLFGVTLLVALLGMATVAWATSVNDGFVPNTDIGGDVTAIALQADGRILVGGFFTTISGQSRDHIARLNTDGSVDEAFNPGADNAIYAIVIQADGKILVGGWFTSIAGKTRNHIARLNEDGSLDADFDPIADNAVYSIALQADGKILVGGNLTSICDRTRNRIARLNEDGSLDDGFDPNANEEVKAIALQANGKILVGGNFTSIGGQSRIHIARLNANGSVDPGFSPGASEAGYVQTLVVQADGKILAGGVFTSIGVQARSNIARLNADGGVDAGFNPGADSIVNFILLQADGKILVGGHFLTISGQSRSCIARLHRDGSLETGFNPGPNGYVTSLAIQADGKILVGGDFTTISGQARICIARLNTDGNLEMVFNPEANGAVQAITIQASGEILVGGNFSTIGGVTRNRIARLDVNGTVDTDFTPGADNWICSINVQADGNILVGGTFTTIGGQSRNNIARLNSDGMVDTSFNVDTPNGTVYAIALQQDGKVLVGGAFTAIGDANRNHIARLNADGSVDTGFDPGANADVYSIAVQADGKALVGGGFSTMGAYSRGRIARLNSDGSVDTDFYPVANGNVCSIAIQANGNILIGGGFTTIDGRVRTYLARLTENGVVDNFNPTVDNSVYSITLQADGKILVGGDFTNIGYHIARLNSDGFADTDFNPGVDGEVYSITLQNDGKILVGGWFTFIGGQIRLCIARLSADEAALQDLQVSADGSTITWTRGQSSPEIQQVIFEYSEDSTIWTLLGAGTRISRGWQLSGQSLPFDVNGYVRARGRAVGGTYGSSSSILESIRLYYNPAPTTITVSSPNGGESWTVGENHNITWSTTGTIPNVNIDYSIDGGGNWVSVAANEANDGSYAWIVPNTPSANCLVHVSDTDGDPLDQNDAVFTIASVAADSITVTSPNGGESWTVGETHEITWTSTGNIPSVSINYSIDGGACYYYSIGEAIENDGSFTWTVEDTPSETCLVQVISAAAGDIPFDQSDAVFRILALPSSFTISGTVTWKGSPLAGVAMNGLEIEPAPVTDASGFYSASVDRGWSGTVTPSLSGYTFDPVSRDYTNISADYSAQDYVATSSKFTISGIITWIGTPLAGVTMNGLDIEPAPVTDASGFYSASVDRGWSGTVTPYLQYYAFTPASTTYENVSSDHTTDYTATLDQSLAVTSPDSTSLWEKGKTYAITWLKQGTQNDYVKIMLYRGTSTPVMNISTKTPNNGRFRWQVPTTLVVGSTYFIRVKTIDNLFYDDSDQFSIIVPNITIITPTAGNIWMKGATHTITWTKQGTQDSNVKIQLKGTKELSITSNTLNNGTFDWAIPSTMPNGNYTIEITTLDGKLKAVSKSFIITLGIIQITQPTAGARLIRGTQQVIAWTSEGSVYSSVKIDLLGGRQVLHITSSTPTANGAFTWNIPDNLLQGTNYYIQITSLGNPDKLVSGKTGKFAIVAGIITVTQPTLGAAWQRGLWHTITWTSEGEVGTDVKILLYKGTSTLVRTLTNRTNNNGSYEWPVPADLAVGNTYFIRIMSSANMIDGDSEKFSIIVPTIIITAPTSGTVWVKNATKTITWTKLGIQNSNVSIQLKGTKGLSIASTTPNNGTFDWAIPSTLPNGTYTIEITTLDRKVKGVSENFNIANGMIQITQPEAGAKLIRGTALGITWTSEGIVNANVRIDLFKGTRRILDISGRVPTADGTFIWTIPAALALAANYSIKITALDNLASGKTGDLAIVVGIITITDPTSGTVWEQGHLDQPHTITWTKEGDQLDADVTIQLIKGLAIVSTLVYRTPNDGNYVFLFHAPQTPASTYKIRITTLDNLVTAESEQFTISDSVGLNLLAPSGGEILSPQEPFTIKWSDDPDIVDVKLEFSRDNGSTYTTIADRVENTGRYDWIVPVNFTRNGIVRVSDSNGKPWRDDGLLEFSFKFIYSGEGEEPGAIFWFGGSDPKSPGYGFARIEIGSAKVQFGGIAKTIGPLAAAWHELRVRFDFRRDTAEICLDDQVLFANAALSTTQEHYFQPYLVLQAGGDALIDFTLDDLAINVVQLDSVGEDKHLFNALEDDFDRYDEKVTGLQNCWQWKKTNATETRVELNVENPKNKSLRLRSETGKQLMIYLPFALPDKVPFDITDKCVVIENQ